MVGAWPSAVLDRCGCARMGERERDRAAVGGSFAAFARRAPRSWCSRSAGCWRGSPFQGVTDGLPSVESLKKWPKRAPRRRKTAPRWPNMAPRWPQDGPRRPRIDPKTRQDGPQDGRRWPKTAPGWPKTAPRWPKIAEDRSRSTKMSRRSQ